MIKTRFTELLGCERPIMLAGMGPFTTYKTATLVSNAGGVGLTSHWGVISPVNPDKGFIIDRENGVTISSVKKMKYDLKYFEENLNDGAIAGCNVRVARMSVDAPRVVRTIVKERERSKKLKECVKIVVTSAGNPVPPNKIIKNPKFYKDGKPDLYHFHVSPSLALVKNTIKAGCDGVVAVGIEGGGHQSYEEICTSVLIPEIRDAFPDKPIVAGGGFFDGNTLASALALGADGIQMGSRFIATIDGDFHINFKNALIKGQDADTMICQGGFGPIRILRNKYALSHRLIMSKEDKIKQEKAYGIDQDLSQQLLKDGRAYEATYEGDMENGAVLCGQTICGIRDLPTVKDLMDKIMKQAEARIKLINTYVD